VVVLMATLFCGRCAMNDERRATRRFGGEVQVGCGCGVVWCAKRLSAYLGQRKEAIAIRLDAGDRRAAANRTRPEGAVDPGRPISMQ
jgi:hypothetical protein